MRNAGITKNDALALRHYDGGAYAAIPKSAFAILAWHLGNLASGACGADGAAEARLIEEADALALNGLLPEAHAKAIRKALAGVAAQFDQDEGE
jgi:hypothetical protein